MSEKKNVVFLYFYGLHQLYHSVHSGFELATLKPDWEILLLSCNKEHTAVLKEVAEKYSSSNIKIIQIPAPLRYRFLNFKKKTYPSVNAMVNRSKKYLKKADAVVTTSHGTPKMFRKYNITKPKIVYQEHGCGDRSYGFSPEFLQFDYLLASGDYHKNRLINEKFTTQEQISVVGYPKFDYKPDTDKLRKSLFKNENPIVLYTPHWDKKLTSYDKYARFVLNYFKENKQYNLIFAPHVQLFHWSVRHDYNVKLDHFKTDNIHIDFGSINSTNNAYTTVADLYLGDVSSQVYEWIALKPRPCLFLNAHNAQWKNNKDYRFWEYGPVVENSAEFDEKLKRAFNDKTYIPLQQERVKQYMHLTSESSSLRAAKTLVNIVEKL